MLVLLPQGHFLCLDQQLTSMHLQYPAAYRIHVNHCKNHSRSPRTHDIPVLQAQNERSLSTRLPIGTAQIIPPQPSDTCPGEEGHWVICLFTSYGYGRRADPVDQIINNTYAALQDLKRQLERLNREQGETGAAAPGTLFACRFNSGLFAVPWAKTRELIEDVGLEMIILH